MPGYESEPEVSGKLQFLCRRWLKKTKLEKIPRDVKNLFDNFSDSGIMPECKLIDFLTADQGVDESTAKATAQKIIASRNFKGIRNCSRHGLSSNGFLQFLLNKKFNPPLIHKELKEREKFAHYFVYTSQRSYFKQKSKSRHQSNTSGKREHENSRNSTKAIKKALKNGVKVIELDLFPSSDKTTIHVHHVHHPRRTEGQSRDILTLRDCLEVINEKAFYTSDYPVIIILEEHFESLSPQDASNLRKNLKKLIYKAFGEENLCSREPAFNQLLLCSLKRKFIILKRHRTQQEPTFSDKNEVAEEEKYVAGFVEELESEFQNQPSLTPGKPTILRMTENNLDDSTSSEIVRFTQDNILLVKPKDHPHAMANNYDPLSCWTLGIQMAAFNMQHSSKHLYIMQGLFRAQGADGTIKPTGYVKKPNTLLNPTEIFDPRAWHPVKRILKVKVYLGTGWHLDFDSKQFDKTSHPDFFAAVEIVGVPEDEAREKTIPASNQLIPFWDQEFEFPLTVPSLAMLMIEVREFDVDRTHDFAGQTCLPVCQLKRGIRSVPLYDREGNVYNSARLLMRFELD